MKRIICILFLVISSFCLACGKTDRITVEEYVLEAHPEAPYSSPLYPQSETTLQVTRDVLDEQNSAYSVRCKQTLARNNELLLPFGYSIDSDSHLVYNDRELLRDVSWADCSPASINASNDDFVLVVHQPGPEGLPDLYSPFYFYRRDDALGISYGGQECPLNYDAVYHFGCCDDSAFNPRYTLGKASFFARCGGQWYLVEVRVRS